MSVVSAFSHFSAVSELFVSAAVYYVLWMAWRRNDFRGGLLAVVLTFETLVNITYMAIRTIAPSPSLLAGGSGMSALLAVHGTLSLLMFAGLIGFAVEAQRLKREGRNAVRERPRMTLAFAVLWGLSVGSGELIYVLQLTQG